MEQRLVVMRHAQAKSPNPGDADHERRLTDRGRLDARRIAERLAELGWVPDRVICSDSARTVETWIRMIGGMPGPIDVLATSRLYGAGLGELSSVAAEQPDAIRTLLAIGHNPGWEAAVSELSGQLVPLGTANAALLSRTGGSGWRGALDPGSWRLVDVLRPKDPPG